MCQYYSSDDGIQGYATKRKDENVDVLGDVSTSSVSIQTTTTSKKPELTTVTEKQLQKSTTKLIEERKKNHRYTNITEGIHLSIT